MYFLTPFCIFSLFTCSYTSDGSFRVHPYIVKPFPLEMVWSEKNCSLLPAVDHVSGSLAFEDPNELKTLEIEQKTSIQQMPFPLPWWKMNEDLISSMMINWIVKISAIRLNESHWCTWEFLVKPYPMNLSSCNGVMSSCET